MSCIKCNVANNEPSLNCDSCERIVHVNSDCSGLNASELKVKTLKGKRTLRFLCEECLMGVRLVPKLMKKIDDLQEEVNKLKTFNQHLTLPYQKMS
ncbi:hypothetical protein JTB14_007861 [Gonioctena quinquepunctata]|nr:hypothetical protein JTB14_007861 [Gonioctena quinquepunctata]